MSPAGGPPGDCLVISERRVGVKVRAQGYSVVEFGWCSQGMACSGQAATSRVAAAMLGVSMRFNKYTATFRKDASTCGAFPLRTRHRSSPKVTSRT